MRKRTSTRKHHVLMVAAECRDIATAGGLGDVVRELSKAIHRRGILVSIAMPYYGVVTKSAVSLGKFKVPFGNRSWEVEWFRCTLDGATIYLLRKREFFDGRNKTVYIHSRQHPFEDDGRRFAFFSSAVLAFIQQYAQLRSVDTLHCHDWHTGALFTLLKYDPRYKDLSERVRTVFTIHNLEYQGVRPFSSRIRRRWFAFSDWFPSLYPSLKASGAIHDLRNPKPPLRWFNPMRAAVQLSDHVNTVSPSYALELTRADNPKLNFSGGRGLEHDIARRKRQRRFHGILNGLDHAIHTPSTLRPAFDVTMPGWEKIRMQHKYALIQQLPSKITQFQQAGRLPTWNAKELTTQLSTYHVSEWVARPLVIMVTRAADQKIKMLMEKHHGKPLLEHILHRDLSLLILATGERERILSNIVNLHPNAIFICAFERTLARRIYAAGDLFLMPSDFEPCGISQLISMRYGCLPLVHGIGGLQDTVDHNATGFVFTGNTRARTRQALLETLDAALHRFIHDRRRWRQMQRQAMQARFDWTASIEQYLALYFDS
ncbi:MAG TPA: glycogen synthase [Nitrospirales bacterium]|nr:glycogen synthase [Nitrospirales bacterium]